MCRAGDEHSDNCNLQRFNRGVNILSYSRITSETIPTLIFDCDGVLIDSEIVVCRLVSEELTSLGYPVSVTEVISRYAGRPEPAMIADIEQDWGRSVPAEYFPRIKARVAQAYASELRPVSGVAETLARIQAPVCVASSSAPQKLRLGLESTGLHARFGQNIVSASYVAQGKPAPDVFIYAAGWMRAQIEHCVVIEDSIPGVEAARKAGIRTFGFVGGSHCPPEHEERLLATGAEHVLRNIRDLERYLPQAFGIIGIQPNATPKWHPKAAESV
ncbi:HAD family hydrolase [Methylorubrum extorquens]